MKLECNKLYSSSLECDLHHVATTGVWNSWHGSAFPYSFLPVSFLIGTNGNSSSLKEDQLQWVHGCITAMHYSLKSSWFQPMSFIYEQYLHCLEKICISSAAERERHPLHSDNGGKPQGDQWHKDNNLLFTRKLEEVRWFPSSMLWCLYP